MANLSLQQATYRVDSSRSATISFAPHRLTLEKLEKGVRCTVDGSARIIYFSNENELAVKLGAFLDEKIGKAGEARPRIREQIARAYRDMSLQGSAGEGSASAQATAKDFKIEQGEGWARVSCGGEVIKIYKMPTGIRYEFGRVVGPFIVSKPHFVRLQKPLRFSDEGDLSEELGVVLKNHTSLRGSMGAWLPSVYKDLNLSESKSQTALDLPVGRYKFEDGKPEAFLLIKNRETNAAYCLTFVQAMFDLIYGPGSAQKLGLYTIAPKAYVDGLRTRMFDDGVYNKDMDKIREKTGGLRAATVDINESACKVYSLDEYRAKYPEGSEPPVGTIFRLSIKNTGDYFLRSMAIYIGNGKIAHLAADTLSIEDMNKAVYHKDGKMWGPETPFVIMEVLVPNAAPNLIEPRRTEAKFAKGTNLGAISARFSSKLHANDAIVQELIYQLNRKYFEIKGNAVQLREDVDGLLVPGNWPF